MQKFTIKQFHETYPDDAACLAAIFQHRYGDLTKCPECKKETRFYRVKKRKCYACQVCGYQLHPLADTIFHKSDTSLKSWFYAIFLFANSRNGVSAKELERQLGVTYKTAWRMAKQIRLLCANSKQVLSGTVEMDETYIGGERKRGQGRKLENKTPVVGLVQRRGRVVARALKSLKGAKILPLVRYHVLDGTPLMTDEGAVYQTLGQMGYPHETVTHKTGEYVRGPVHTNTIEGFWGQVKRSIKGTYHAVSRKYLQSYLDEFSYRFDLRHLETSLFYPMISRAARPA